MPDPFATPEDLADRWRALSPAEEARAVVLLDDASRLIRGAFAGIDARIGTDVDEGDLRMVAANMVKRAMLGTEVEGVTSEAQTVGPFSVTRQYQNPLGNLYLSATERDLLGGVAAGRPRAGSFPLRGGY